MILGLERSPGEGKGYPLHYSGLENSMDCIVHGVAESDTTERLSLSYGIRSHQFMANRGGKSGSSDISFSQAPKEPIGFSSFFLLTDSLPRVTLLGVLRTEPGNCLAS